MSRRTLLNQDFSVVHQQSGHYQNVDIAPLNPVTSLVGSVSQNITFQIDGSTVLNMSKSSITYNYQVTAPVGTFYNAFEDICGLELASAITFFPNQGTNMVALYNPGLYAKILPKLDVPLDVYTANDDTTGFHLAKNALNVLPVPITGAVGNSYCLPANSYNATDLNQPQYIRTAAVGTAIAPGGGTVYTFSRVIPLGQLTGTMFSLKHDQFFGSTMNLQLATAPVSNFGFTTTALSTGAAILNTPAANVSNISLSSVQLNLSVQMDPDIVDKVMRKAKSGSLRYLCPYITVIPTMLPAGQSSASINLSSALGKKVKRITNVSQYQTPAIAATSVYDISNVSGSKIQNYYTSFANQQLQRKTNNNCVIANTASPTNVLDDYRENKRFLVDTCLQDAIAYQYNWSHTDSFGNKSNVPNSLDSNQIDEGYTLPMGNTLYSFSCQAAAPLNLYTFVETMREVAITAQGPVWQF
jgi:hypothetical protein